MEETKNKSEQMCTPEACGKCGKACGGSWCGAWCGGHRFIVLRIIIGIIILVVVFSLGVKLGELKSYLSGGSYGSSMMRGWGVYGKGYRMMQPGAGYGTQCPAAAYDNSGIEPSAPQ